MLPLPSICGSCGAAETRGCRVQRGKFITIEGIEGVGKSTNMDFLADLIETHGHPVMKTREPGGTPIAEDIRHILKDHGAEPLPDVAELLLMFAARSINVNNAIRPALEGGTWVISDRFTDSTRAYQGGGRGALADTGRTRQQHGMRYPAVPDPVQPRLREFFMPNKFFQNNNLKNSFDVICHVTVRTRSCVCRTGPDRVPANSQQPRNAPGR